MWRETALYNVEGVYYIIVAMLGPSQAILVLIIQKRNVQYYAINDQY